MSRTQYSTLVHNTLIDVCVALSEMVNLDSYDSEGLLTPETDDSTEVRLDDRDSYVSPPML